MRVGVYVSQLRPESGGGYTFVTDLLDALARVKTEHSFQILHLGQALPVARAGLSFVQLPDPVSPLDSALDTKAHELGLDLIWFPIPEFQPVTLPYIATVWDLEHRNQPHFPEVSVSGWLWEQRELFYRTTLPRATWIVVGTPEGKRQIERFYGVPAERIAVIPLPAPGFTAEELLPDRARLVELGIRAPFLFYPAQFWPHKNHVVLLHALKLLVEQHGSDVQLVLTGADKGNLGHVQKTAALLGLTDRVRFLGFVERRLVATLYGEALALTFPSFFGPDNLPPLEAFTLGCPVLTSALPGTAELFGDAALRIDPTDEAAWAVAVAGLLRNAGARDALRERGRERGRAWMPGDYVRAVVEKIDAFESVRRCWGRSEGERGAQPAVP